MIKVGILSFSDGRDRVHATLRDYIAGYENHVATVLDQTGEVELIRFPDIVHSNALAREAGAYLDSRQPDVVLFCVPVFSYPNFALISYRMLHAPVMAISPVNPAYPGMGGLQAATNIITQTGGECDKLWGNIEEPRHLTRVMAFLRAAHAATRLNGQVLGLFGGRSIGMGSGAINPDLWMNLFGVDVDHVDQSEILRRAALIDPERATQSRLLLEKKMGGIEYDGGKLTPENLGMQVRCYLALREIVQEKGMDFVAVKCHDDLSEHAVTQCLSAAFFNDPYDWFGEKEPIVYSCEADGDGALTMQILKLVSGKPVLFMDFRHYFEEAEAFAFCNCGGAATWYAGRSACAEENLSQVRLCPVIPKYGGRGCHVRYMASAGEMTFARLSRRLNDYTLQVFTGDFTTLSEDYMQKTCNVWPHGFTRVDADPETLVQRFRSNHIHAVAGDVTAELECFCRLKGIAFERIDA